MWTRTSSAPTLPRPSTWPPSPERPRPSSAELKGPTMVPPRLIRRLVLAPVVMIIAVALIVLFPVLALVALVLGLVHLSRPGRMRGLRLLWFAVVWLAGETAALFVLAGLWGGRGVGGRVRHEADQNRK